MTQRRAARQSLLTASAGGQQQSIHAQTTLSRCRAKTFIATQNHETSNQPERRHRGAKRSRRLSCGPWQQLAAVRPPAPNTIPSQPSTVVAERRRRSAYGALKPFWIAFRPSTLLARPATQGRRPAAPGFSPLAALTGETRPIPCCFTLLPPGGSGRPE